MLAIEKEFGHVEYKQNYSLNKDTGNTKIYVWKILVYDTGNWGKE